MIDKGARWSISYFENRLMFVEKFETFEKLDGIISRFIYLHYTIRSILTASPCDVK